MNLVVKRDLSVCSSLQLIATLYSMKIEIQQAGLGERVFERRQALHITQQDLARSLGVTPQHISLIEQNKVTPSLALLAGLATELGVSVDYLVSGKEGIITDTVPAIKADKRLKIKAKKALIAMVEELYQANDATLEKNSPEQRK